MVHLELFNNLSSKEFRSLEESGQPDILPTRIYVKHALTTPYLMHQMLAASALHLSIKSPEYRRFWREYSRGLQTRALSLFNESNPVLEVTAANCVQMFLFSSLMGVYLLCDALHYERGSLETFIDSFTRCLSFYRGVLAIMDRCEHLLHDSELGPYLKISHVPAQPADTAGTECDALQGLADAADLSTASREAYREAILCLQQVFSAQRVASANKSPMPVGLAWPALVLSKYVDLLRQRQGEALAILAHFAVLLHRGRHLWLIGDGGKFLIESISESLGTDWQVWVTFPNRILRGESTT